MMTDQKPRKVLAGVLSHPRYEVIPLKGIEEAVIGHVPKDIEITVTASPTKGIENTLDLAERLAGEGFRVSPHLSARLIRDRTHLAEILERMREGGVGDVFVVAGDPPEPVGEFEDAHSLLVAMAEIGHHLREVGITGYPESHPFISDEALIQAMYDKEPYATYIVSQICFDAGIISNWARRVKQRGVKLPIYVGIPGVVNRQKLMRISANIGLGQSARFLRKQGNSLLRLFLPGGYSPKRVIEVLAPTFAESGNNVAGLHINTFNEIERTEKWRRQMLNRLEKEA